MRDGNSTLPGIWHRISGQCDQPGEAPAGNVKAAAAIGGGNIGGAKSHIIVSIRIASPGRIENN
jgi:hypothetical protein